MSANSLIRGLAIGAAIGVATGLLLAPASGDKTRKKIMKGSGKLLKSSGKLKKSVQDYVETTVGDLRDQFNEKIDRLARTGKDTINHVSDKVKV